MSTNKPWFGPKRIGWGWRPQTGPAWVLTLLPAVIVVVVVLAVALAH